MALSSEGQLRERICAFGRSIFDRGLTAGSSGNISVRLPDECGGGWLMTPTNASLGSLDPARLSKIAHDGRLLSGDKPTKEQPLHTAVYAARNVANAIVHLHSHHSVAVSVLRDIDPERVLPPLTAYYVMRVGRLPLVPYFRPGDPAVAEVIGRLAAEATAVLLANHGPVVSGDSLEAAVYATEELEETARLFLTLYGKPVRELDDEQIEDLRRVFGANW
ncbi:MAG: 3-oxo-tetronate 4-phosphate decarboxylase [Rhodospirillales bacterium]